MRTGEDKMAACETSAEFLQRCCCAALAVTVAGVTNAYKDGVAFNGRRFTRSVEGDSNLFLQGD
jgi:hypothetical protein